ncbi:hypothetical protein WS93_22985 [Burkholderia cepacia]|nr:hypothetical protein WS93_22985 [Burkholderia cepacia]
MRSAKIAASDVVARNSGAVMREDTVDDWDIVDADYRTDRTTEKKTQLGSRVQEARPGLSYRDDRTSSSAS